MSAIVVPYGIRFQDDGQLDVFPALAVHPCPVFSRVLELHSRAVC